MGPTQQHSGNGVRARHAEDDKTTAVGGTKTRSGSLHTLCYFPKVSLRVSVERAAGTTAQSEEGAGRGDRGRAVGRFGLRSPWVCPALLMGCRDHRDGSGLGFTLANSDATASTW